MRVLSAPNTPTFTQTYQRQMTPLAPAPAAIPPVAITHVTANIPHQPSYRAPTDRIFYLAHTCQHACLKRVRPETTSMHRGKNPLLTPLLYDFRRMTGRRKVNRKVNMNSSLNFKMYFLVLLYLCRTLPFYIPTPQMSFHVIYKAPCGLCLRNMAEIQQYLFQTSCDFIFLEMFCLDPYVLVDRPFQPQRPFYYIPDITGGKEDIPLSCVNEIDSTPPPSVAYSKNNTEMGLF